MRFYYSKRTNISGRWQEKTRDLCYSSTTLSTRGATG